MACRCWCPDSARARLPPPPPAGIIGLECSYIIPIFLRLTVARKWFKKARWRGAGPGVCGPNDPLPLVCRWCTSVWLPTPAAATAAAACVAQGPFHLGPLSVPIGVIGCVWGCFISVVLCLPTIYPITNK